MIAIGCDHGGYYLKQDIIDFLEKNGYEYKDYGTYSDESCDYPVYAKKVAQDVYKRQHLMYKPNHSIAFQRSIAYSI